MARRDSRLLASASVTAGALLFWPLGLASATTFNWTYTVSEFGGDVVASGTLEATLSVGDEYVVTAISGMRDGVPITGLGNYANSDNLVFFGGSGPYVDDQGLAFLTNASPLNAFNVSFRAASDTDRLACRFAPPADGYCEVGPGPNNTDRLDGPDPVDKVVSFTLTTASTPIPEPSTWALMLLGFAGLGWRARAPRESRSRPDRAHSSTL